VFVKDKEVPNSLCTPLKLFYHPMMALKNAYFKDGQEDVYKIREKALSIISREMVDTYTILTINPANEFDGEDFGVAYALYLPEIAKTAFSLAKQQGKEHVE